jgi:hypothetical protein
MILNTGLNATRDLLNVEVVNGDWGTGTAAAFPSDAGLQFAGSGTIFATTNAVADKTLIVTAVLPSTAGGTAVYAEHATLFDGGAYFNRVAFSPITKSPSKSIHNISTVVLTNGNI